MHRRITALLPALLLLAGGCSTTIDSPSLVATSPAHGDPAYDRVVVDSVQVCSELSDTWIASALRDSMEMELLSNGLSSQTTAPADHELALRVLLTGAAMKPGNRSEHGNPSYTLTGRVDLVDGFSGRLVDSTPLQAVYVDDPCKGGVCVIRPVAPDEGALRRGAVDLFAARVAKLAAGARSLSQRGPGRAG